MSFTAFVYAVDVMLFSLYLSVSTAIGLLGDTAEKANDWSLALETILLIISNILKYPNDPKYFRISVTNPNFHRRYCFYKCSSF